MEYEHKEKRKHGSNFFPFHVYTHQATDRYFVFYHWHDEVEIIYVEQGEMEIIVNGTTFILHEDDVIFIEPGSLHQIQAKEASIHHAIVFHPKLLDFQSFDHVQSVILTPLREGKVHYPVAFSANDAWKAKIQQQLLTIIKDAQKDDVSAKLKIKIDLLSFILLLYEHGVFETRENQERESLNLERIKLIITYMLSHIGDKITLQELADVVSMDQHYFCRFFKAQTGLSPIRYLLTMRIEESAKLLSVSDLKVLDIALCCGFDNFSYYIRQFKTLKGMTPNQYRSFVKQVLV